MTRKLSDIFAALEDENAIVNYQTLGSLSDLNAREMAQFQEAWHRLSPGRRQKVIEALVELAEEHVEYDYRTIFRWALDDTDAHIRLLAIEGLWEDENPRLLSAYRRLLQTDPVESVRAAAATALGWFVYWYEMGSIQTDLIDDAVQALWDAFLDDAEHVDVRRRALEAISASSRPGIERLIEMALFGGDIPMRISALYAMGRSADTRWISFLLPELSRPEASLRLEAVRSLGELEAKSAVRPIIQLIAQEPDTEVRLAALAALGQIGGAEARKALEAATDWDDEATVSAAEAALEELQGGAGGAFELIDEILGDEGEDDDWDDEDDYDGDYDEDYDEDPLDRELRQLLDDRDSL
ncbi:MAG: HEAT repeat domain-containing protein [Caldilineales bacterium]|nr:HEAT repeat domain-containing protein [Caldilineales bacterium]